MIGSITIIADGRAAGPVDGPGGGGHLGRIGEVAADHRLDPRDTRWPRSQPADSQIPPGPPGRRRALPVPDGGPAAPSGPERSPPPAAPEPAPEPPATGLDATKLERIRIIPSFRGRGWEAKLGSPPSVGVWGGIDGEAVRGRGSAPPESARKLQRPHPAAGAACPSPQGEGGFTARAA